MGLGKTLQVLCFLQIIHSQSPHSHFMIVVPNSLLLNWESEINKWTPELKCLVLAGSQQEKESKREEYIENKTQYSILLTR